MDFYRFSFLLLAWSLLGCQNSPQEAVATEQEEEPVHWDERYVDFWQKETFSTFENLASSPSEEEINMHIRVRLDSSSKIKVGKAVSEDTLLMLLNGAAGFFIKKGESAVELLTGMLVITTSDADFRIEAYSDRSGQSLKVFRGSLVASKAYESDFAETDTLIKGEMVMINRDIDLMEKETFDISDSK